MLQAARADTWFVPFSYFWHLLERESEPVAELRPELIPSINRRIRIRPPTCLSTGLAILLTVLLSRYLHAPKL